MDKTNINLLHGMLFAMAAVVMVYAGDQVKTKSTGAPAICMKVSAATAGASIVAMAASFLFAMKSNKFRDFCEQHKTEVSGLYGENPPEKIELKTVQDIAKKSQDAGVLGALQDLSHRWNMRLTVGSIILLAIAACLFGIGVCIL